MPPLNSEGRCKVCHELPGQEKKVLELEKKVIKKNHSLRHEDEFIESLTIERDSLKAEKKDLADENSMLGAIISYFIESNIDVEKLFKEAIEKKIEEEAVF